MAVQGTTMAADCIAGRFLRLGTDPPVAGIFICYRREDTAHAAGRLYDALANRFGDDLLFMDLDKIPWGGDYVDVIRQRLESATVVLVLIGHDWLGTQVTGRS